MKSIVLLKAIRNTHVLKKGQKCWMIFGTGACAAQILTKFRGSGRWIKYWVHWEDKNGKAFMGGNPNVKWIGKVDVSDEFFKMYERLGRW